MPGVIADTSPLQYLHQTELLDLLPTLFGRIDVPDAVVAEIGEGRRRRVNLPDLETLSWVTIRSVTNRTLLPLATGLGSGEREVLALGLESPDSLLVLDDEDARRHARTIGLDVVGTLGVLLRAKETGALKALRPVLNVLEALRFHVGNEVRHAVLKSAGEAEGG